MLDRLLSETMALTSAKASLSSFPATQMTSISLPTQECTPSTATVKSVARIKLKTGDISILYGFHCSGGDETLITRIAHRFNQLLQLRHHFSFHLAMDFATGQGKGVKLG